MNVEEENIWKINGWPFSEVMAEINPPIQESLWTPNKINKKKSTHRLLITKL